MDRFSKNDTLIVKGLAMLMLICHHLGMGILPAPISWSEAFSGRMQLYTTIATLCKVCVAIFIMLSGYGLFESFKKNSDDTTLKGDVRFVGKRIFKLLKQYWFIFAIFVPLGFLNGASPLDAYGRSFSGVIYFLIDAIGMRSLFTTPTMNQTWWYMEAIIVLYIAFPILRRLIKKTWSSVMIVILSIVPLVIFTFFNDGSIDGCREIYWFLPFVCGMLLSKHSVLDKFCIVCKKNPKAAIALSLAAVLTATYIRSKTGMIFDTVYAIAIIVFSKAVLSRIKYLSGLLSFFGVHSGNVFMMHSFLYCYYLTVKQMLFAVPSPIFNYCFFVLECIVCSDYIEILKKRLSKAVKAFMDKRRKKETVEEEKVPISK